jgi:hypothetical protein
MFNYTVNNIPQTMIKGKIDNIKQEKQNTEILTVFL